MRCIACGMGFVTARRAVASHLPRMLQTAPKGACVCDCSMPQERYAPTLTLVRGTGLEGRQDDVYRRKPSHSTHRLRPIRHYFHLPNHTFLPHGALPLVSHVS